MKKALLLLLAALLLLPALPVCTEDRPVLTIGDVIDRSSTRMDGDNQLGLWQFLEDQLGVEIQFVYSGQTGAKPAAGGPENKDSKCTARPDGLGRSD